MVDSSQNIPPLVDLLTRARNGDEAARDALFEKCRAYVNIVARAHMESWMQAKVDASDLVQQTLLEAHRGLTDFRGTTEAEWLAWLKRILSHNATDFVRRFKMTEKRAANREVPLDRPETNQRSGFSFEPPDPGDSPSVAIMRKEQELLMADAVTQLSPDYQDVIMLRNLQRLPFDEVAERMGRSRAATQMLWMRAIRKLREVMEVPASP